MTDFVPRPYQVEAEQQLFDYFVNGGSGNPLVLMPTGSGKSSVIAMSTTRIMQYPKQRVMILTHVKELIGQNYNTFVRVSPHISAGIYSAGLKERNPHAPVIFAGAQSVVKSLDKFGWIDIIKIDEAHLVSVEDASRYQKIIQHFTRLNPNLRVVGYSATGYRMGQGLLTDPVLDRKDGSIRPALFSDVATDWTTPEAFAMFFAKRHLVRPIPVRTTTQFDVASLRITGGEFNAGQMQANFDTSELNHKILTEFCGRAHNRRSWLLFCAGIEHAEHCADMLTSMGITTLAVHSKMSDAERDRRILAYKRGEVRAMTNNGVLTTGFDDPKTDALAIMRATLSTPLHVQIIGRGMRPCEDGAYNWIKQDCLVADFAGNTERCGPIDMPVIPKKPGLKTIGDMPVKICPKCETYNHTRAKFCINCNLEFTFDTKLGTKASNTELVSGEAPIVETWDVNSVAYSRVVSKAAGKAMLKAIYFCDTKHFSELVLFDHDGYVKNVPWIGGELGFLLRSSLPVRTRLCITFLIAASLTAFVFI